MTDKTTAPTATPEQVAMFKMGAATEYKAQGVPPQIAEQLFASQMQKLADDLRAMRPEVTQLTEALRASLKPATK